ncbi:hypothetical protein KC901_03000 [Patescibacteria group bacterium]|nr:hypothetical protein [Patescibacteria group bacterium]
MSKSITKLFETLSLDKQRQTLEDLNKIYTTNTIRYVVELAQFVQRMYKQNISFEITKEGPDHEPIITAVVHVPFKKKRYVGKGKNKKIAKAIACEKACDDANT